MSYNVFYLLNACLLTVALELAIDLVASRGEVLVLLGCLIVEGVEEV